MVEAVLGVDECRRRLERVVDVGHERQLFPLDLDGGGAGLGRLGRLGDDERELVGLPSADVDGTVERPVCSTPTRTGWSNMREAVLVHGHVGGGEHRHHAIDPSAAEVSRRTTRAWGWSVNTTLADSASAGMRSPEYCAVPWYLGPASMRSELVPTVTVSSSMTAARRRR